MDICVIYLWSPLSPKHMQNIFINSFRTCIYSHGTYPNPFLNFGWRCMDLLRLRRGTTVTGFSLPWEAEEIRVMFYSKMWYLKMNRPLTFYTLIPYGLYPLGYWASRVLGPSSKTRDGVWTLHIGSPYSWTNKKQIERDE